MAISTYMSNFFLYSFGHDVMCCCCVSPIIRAFEMEIVTVFVLGVHCVSQADLTFGKNDLNMMS